MHDNVAITILQLGESHLHVRDVATVIVVPADLPESIVIHVKQPDLDGTAGENDKVLKAFPQLALTAVGKTNLFKDSKIRPRTELTLRTYKKETIQAMEGTTIIAHDKLNAVLRRSGADGIIIDSTEYDPTITLLTAPPAANTLDKAFQLALAMGELAFGATYTQFGLRIRIKEGTENEAKHAMTP